VNGRVFRDPFGRRIDYLRLSVTDRCDLRCSYCMPRAFKDFAEPAEWLTFDEIERVVRAFVELGVARVRLTGGEPLVGHADNSVMLSRGTSVVVKAQSAGNGRPFPRAVTQPTTLVPRPFGSRCVSVTELSAWPTSCNLDHHRQDTR